MRANTLALASLSLALGAYTSALGGTINTRIGNNTDNQAFAGAVQSDGSIVVAGYTTGSKGKDTAVVRYQSGGQLDSSFNGSGIYVQSASGNGQANACLIQPDGKIVVAGSAVAGRSQGFDLIRLNSNGSLDSGFGKSGTTLAAYSSSYDSVGTGLAQLDDGRLVEAGYLYGTNRWLLALLRTDGKLDTTFGSGGWIAPLIGKGGRAYAVTAHQGAIAVVGYTTNAAGNSQATIAWYQTNGTPATGFGTGGVSALLPPGAINSGAYAVSVDDVGRLLVAGYTTFDGNQGSYWMAARLDATGVLDPSFGTGGIALVPSVISGGYGNQAVGIAPGPGGTVVVAGKFASPTVPWSYGAARLLSDGTPDPSFNGGQIALVQPQSGGQPRGLAVQSDGKVLVFGYSSSSAVNYMTTVRFEADGSYSPTF